MRRKRNLVILKAQEKCFTEWLQRGHLYHNKFVLSCDRLLVLHPSDRHFIIRHGAATNKMAGRTKNLQRTSGRASPQGQHQVMVSSRQRSKSVPPPQTQAEWERAEVNSSLFCGHLATPLFTPPSCASTFYRPCQHAKPCH